MARIELPCYTLLSVRKVRRYFVGVLLRAVPLKMHVDGYLKHFRGNQKLVYTHTFRNGFSEYDISLKMK